MGNRDYHKPKPCFKCYSYIKHDAFFGYCPKYKCQARATDNCEIIQKMI